MPLGAARIAFLAKTSITAAAEVYRKPLDIEATGATISTTQSKFGGSSAYFTTAEDYLNLPEGPDLGNSNATWTFECWFRMDSIQNDQYLWHNRGVIWITGPSRPTQPNEVIVGLASSEGTSSLSFYATFTSVTWATNTWYHLAVTHDSGTTEVFVDGSSKGTASTNSWLFTDTTNTHIGKHKTSSNLDFNGYIDEIRVSDTVRYTSGFTPSTTAFTNDSNTFFLAHMDGTNTSTIFVDDNGWPLQLDTLVFDSETTGLGINTHNDWHWNPDGTEFGVVDRIGDAVYNYSLTSAWDETTASRGTSKSISSIDTNARGIALSADGSKMILCGTSTNTLHEFALSTNYDVTSWSTTADSFALNASNTLARGILWNDDGSELYVLDAGGNLFVYTTTTAYQLSGMSYDSTVSLGIDNNSVIAMCWANAGYNLLVTNDSTDDIYSFYCSTPYDAGTLDFRAQFPGNSPSPSAIQVAGTGSKILVYDISDDDISVYYYGAGRPPVTVTASGNAQVDTAQSKFGGASALFDTTGDYLQVDAAQSPAFGTDDFTIEFWIRLENLPSANIVMPLDQRPGSNGAYPLIYITTSEEIVWFVNSAARITTSTSSLSVDTWHHVAVVRSSGTTKIYIDGTQSGSSWTDSTNYAAGRLRIGGNMNSVYSIDGHMDEFRVSNTARYTTSFTPSTSAFTNDANTLLLLHMDGTDGSTVFEDDNGV